MSRLDRVWITRTAPGAGETAERVRAAGFTPVVAPLLVVEPVSVPPLAEGMDVVFTSPNGPRHFRGAVDGTAWCVGERTAEAATALGFQDVRMGPGDVEGLTALLLRDARRPLLHWAGAHVRGQLVDTLRDAGHTAVRSVAYRARAVPVLPPLSPVHAVLLHSPRAAEAFSRLVPTLASPPVEVAVSISAATDAPLATIPKLRRYVAERPDDPAMVAALERVRRDTAQ